MAVEEKEDKFALRRIKNKPVELIAYEVYDSEMKVRLGVISHRRSAHIERRVGYNYYPCEYWLFESASRFEAGRTRTELLQKLSQVVV